MLYILFIVYLTISKYFFQTVKLRVISMNKGSIPLLKIMCCLHFSIIKRGKT